MPNIQVIDGADNCTYDVFFANDEDFQSIFCEEGQDIEFVDDFVARIGEEQAANILDRLWGRRLSKKDVVGIHGTLFFELGYKKAFYPAKKESEMALGI